MAHHFLAQGVCSVPSTKGVEKQLHEALPMDGKVPPIAKTVAPTLLCHEEER